MTAIERSERDIDTGNVLADRPSIDDVRRLLALAQQTDPELCLLDIAAAIELGEQLAADDNVDLYLSAKSLALLDERVASVPDAARRIGTRLRRACRPA